VELLELGVFGGETLEWSCFLSGVAWSSPKHALNKEEVRLFSCVISEPLDLPC
jgi:hypothetical protein